MVKGDVAVEEPDARIVGNHFRTDSSGRRFLWKLFNRLPNEFEITANMAFQLIREMAGNLGSSFFQVLIAFVRSRRDHVLCAISRNLLERVRELKHLLVTLVHNGSGVLLQPVLGLK